MDRDCQVTGSSIDLRSYLGRFSLIFNAVIGKYSSISYGVCLGAASHIMDRPSSHPFIYDESDKFYSLLSDKAIRSDLFDGEFQIGNDVWIGANVTSIRNITIGDGAVIGANSFVNKDVPPYAIAVGSPAKVIGFRYSSSIVDKLLELEWWNWDDERIRRNHSFFTQPVTLETIDGLV